MGYAMVMSPCIMCKRVFGYNPHKVPSVRHPETGQKEPICRACHARANEVRKANGMEPWPEPLEGAYEPMAEEEL